MKRGENTHFFVVVVVLVTLISPHIAHAYIDPGMGSLIIQVVIASIAAVTLFTKSFWSKIKRLFSGRGEKQGDTATEVPLIQSDEDKQEH